MRQLLSYIKSARSAEVTMMLGFPATGILFAFSKPEELIKIEIFIFIVAIFFLSSAIYSYNALAGIKEDEENDRLKNDLGSNKKSFFKWSLAVFVTMFIFLFSFIDILLAILSMVSFLLWFLYSFPEKGLKYRPVAGTVIHFTGQIIHFHMGYIILKDMGIHSLLVSVYFAILFASGHINHELIDYEADKAMNVSSGAVFFGKKKWEKVSFMLFLFSTFYLIILMLLKVTEFVICWPFILAGTVHSVYRLKYLRKDLTRIRFLKERTFYRTVYFLSGAAFLTLKILSI